MTINELEDSLYDIGGSRNIDPKYIKSILKHIKAFSDEEISNYVNKFGETLAQLSALPSMTNDFQPITLALVKKMDLKSLNHRDNDNEILIARVLHHETEIVKKILSKGVDCNIRNASNITLFASVAEFGYLDLLKWLYNNYPDININDDVSDSAIFLSALNNKPHIVEFLLSLHVDLPIYWLEQFGADYGEIIKKYYTLEDDYKLFLEAKLDFLLPQSVTDVFIF